MSVSDYVISRMEDEWKLNFILSQCPPGTSLKFWTDSASGATVLRISRSMTIGWTKSLSDGVVNARWTGMLGAKVSFNLTTPEQEQSVLARIVSAVWDMTLLRTTTWDMAVAEYNDLLDERERLINNHNPIRCPGMRLHTVMKGDCYDCRIEYGDEMYGRKLRDKITTYEVLYQDDVKPERDDGFDPTMF